MNRRTERLGRLRRQATRRPNLPEGSSSWPTPAGGSSRVKLRRHAPVAFDLAAGLVHRPPVLFPRTSRRRGLDPTKSGSNVGHHPPTRPQSGVTLLPHDAVPGTRPDEPPGPIVVVDHGRVIADGTPRTLKAKGRRRPLEVDAELHRTTRPAIALSTSPPT